VALEAVGTLAFPGGAARRRRRVDAGAPDVLLTRWAGDHGLAVVASHIVVNPRARESLLYRRRVCTRVVSDPSDSLSRHHRRRHRRRPERLVTLAVDATLHVRGPEAERRIGIDEFFLRAYRTALRPDELVGSSRAVPAAGKRRSRCRRRRAAEVFIAAPLAVHHVLRCPPVDVLQGQCGSLVGPQVQAEQRNQDGVVSSSLRSSPVTGVRQVLGVGPAGPLG
jgi:hypothetical protein